MRVELFTAPFGIKTNPISVSRMLGSIGILGMYFDLFSSDVEISKNLIFIYNSLKALEESKKCSEDYDTFIEKRLEETIITFCSGF